MTKRQIRAQRRAAQERDYSWQDARDEELDRDEMPDEEHTTADEFADLAREFRG